MAIRSKYTLPMKFQGDGWSGELLPKTGERSGMRCIYKIRMDGDSKRAGLYLSEVHRDGHGNKIVILDVAGDKFIYNPQENSIKYDAKRSYKYSRLTTDPVFIEMLSLTLAHFGVIDQPTGVYTPPAPKVLALTDEEAAFISGFGIF